MKRRDLVTLLGAAVIAAPPAVRAQPASTLRKVGVLLSSGRNDSEQATRETVFLRTLADLGRAAHQNVQYDVRYAGGDLNLAPLAAEIVGQVPDAILATNSAGVTAFRKLTRAIPIVFVNVPDPVGQGFVSSLARPGGNVTGFTNFDYSMGSKWLQLLKEIAPRTRRVVVGYTPRIRSYRRLLNLIGAAAASAGTITMDAPLLTMNDLRRVDDLMSGPGTGLIVLPNFFVSTHPEELIDLAARAKAPAIYPYPEFIPAGGLMSYGASQSEMYRNAAMYVNRILRGARPEDLPVQNPTKYSLSINLKTAKSLGLTVPQSLLIQADELIR